MTVTGSTDFTQTTNCIGPAIKLGTTCTVSVNYALTAIGVASATLRVIDTSGAERQISLTGSGFDLALSLTRPKRPQRSPANSGNQLEFSLELATVGNVDGLVSLACSVPTGAICRVEPARYILGKKTIIKVAVHTPRRAARLAVQSPLPSSLTLKATGSGALVSKRAASLSSVL